MKQVTRGNFQLTKVKTSSKGGLTIEAEITRPKEGGGVDTDPMSVTLSNVPHPDMRAALMNFRAPFLRTMALDGHDELATRVSINSVSLSGTGDNEALKISVNYDTDAGTVSITTPRLRFMQETFGFEVQLGEDFETLTDEAYAYVYKDKYGQLSLFSNAETAEDDGTQE